jgi:hypothetical protein
VVSFRKRSICIDDVSQDFLTTLVYLGGYCTAQQAQELIISDSQARARLKMLERLGFLRRVTKYPVVYQVTKSTTRLLGPDSSSRRRHPLTTVQGRLLAVHFYLEAHAWTWPATFFFDHAEKIMMFLNAQCPLTVLPQRNGKPYLREHLVLWRADRRLALAMIDLPQPGVLSRMRVFVCQYLPLLRCLRQELDLLIVTADQSRCYTYQRLLRTHPAIHKLGLGELIQRVKPYSVRSPVPTITELVWPRREPSEKFLQVHQDTTDKMSQAHTYPEHPGKIIRE